MSADEFCDYTEPGKRCVGSVKHVPGQHELTAWNSATALALDRQQIPDRVKKIAETIKTSEAALAAGDLRTLDEVLKEKEALDKEKKA